MTSSITLAAFFRRKTRPILKSLSTFSARKLEAALLPVPSEPRPPAASVKKENGMEATRSMGSHVFA